MYSPYFFLACLFTLPVKRSALGRPLRFLYLLLLFIGFHEAFDLLAGGLFKVFLANVDPADLFEERQVCVDLIHHAP